MSPPSPPPAGQRRRPWVAVVPTAGGTGATVSALALAEAATRRHQRVLVLDLNPAGHATTALEPVDDDLGVKDVLHPTDPVPLAEVVTSTAWPGVLLACAHRELSNREQDLPAGVPGGLEALARQRAGGALEQLGVDVVVADFPDGLGRVTAAGLFACDRVVGVTRASMFAAQGLDDLMLTVERIRSTHQFGLTFAAAIVAAFEETDDSVRVLAEMRGAYGELMWPHPIPRSHRVSEAIESYHTPLGMFGDPELQRIADMYLDFYDHLVGKGNR